MLSAPSAGYLLPGDFTQSLPLISASLQLARVKHCVTLAGILLIQKSSLPYWRLHRRRIQMLNLEAGRLSTCAQLNVDDNSLRRVPKIVSVKRMKSLESRSSRSACRCKGIWPGLMANRGRLTRLLAGSGRCHFPNQLRPLQSAMMG